MADFFRGPRTLPASTCVCLGQSTTRSATHAGHPVDRRLHTRDRARPLRLSLTLSPASGGDAPSGMYLTGIAARTHRRKKASSAAASNAATRQAERELTPREESRRSGSWSLSAAAIIVVTTLSGDVPPPTSEPSPNSVANAAPAPLGALLSSPALDVRLLTALQVLQVLTVIWARQLVSPQPKLGPVP